MKNTEMLEWMNDLDPKYLTEAEPTAQQPQITVRKKPRRLMPALIAAAVAAAALTAGVSAYISRNTDMLESFFGQNAEEQVTLAELPEPVVYENDYVRLTVETELDDGIRHAILLSCETLDGQPFDWNNFYHADGRANMRFEDGTLTPCSLNGFGFGWDENSRIMLHDDDFPKYWVYYFDYVDDLDELADRGQMYFMFEQRHPAEDTENRLIQIPLNVGQNVKLAEFETPEDFTYQLSCFELIYTGPEENSELPAASHDIFHGDVEDDAEYQAYLEQHNDKYLIFNDGTRRQLNADSGSGLAQTDDGNFTGIWRWCDTEFDFVDTDEVAAIEICGVTYPKIQ